MSRQRTTRFVSRGGFATSLGSWGLGFGLALLAGAAQAQEKFPAKPIEVVTHAGVGGGTDLTARMMMVQAPAAFGTELVFVGKRAGFHSSVQTEINALLVHHARRGLRVVRLKGGDPTIFGRLGEDRLADEQVHALEDICPHAYAMLSQGFQENGQIECPLHAARFDIASGKCLNEIGQHDIRCFPVKVEAGRVSIRIPIRVEEAAK